MRPGVLTAQFSTERGVEAALIRYLSAGWCSHVDVVVPRAVARKHGMPIAGTQALLGARSNGGVQLRPADYAKFTRTARVQVELPDIDAAYSFLFAQLHKPYATRRILDFFLHKFGAERPFNPNRKSWFCDELVYETCMAGGVQLLNTDNPLNLTPQMVYNSPKWEVPLRVRT